MGTSCKNGVLNIRSLPASEAQQDEETWSRALEHFFGAPVGSLLDPELEKAR